VRPTSARSDLVRREESELLKFRNFGRKSLAELSEIIERESLKFGMDVEKYVKTLSNDSTNDFSGSYPCDTE